MNSMAQQAVPNGMGQMELLRPHLTTASTVVVMTSPPPWTPGYVVGSMSFPLKMSSTPMRCLLSHPSRGLQSVPHDSLRAAPRPVSRDRELPHGAPARL